jgi:hypothetical protein
VLSRRVRFDNIEGLRYDEMPGRADVSTLPGCCRAADLPIE